MKNFEELTQKYSTFGDKLLQHTDVLFSIQRLKRFKPITIQIAPTDVCDLKCDYCSVKNRNKSSEIPFDKIISGIDSFYRLGAKSLEITGGGNPLLYKKINELVSYAKSKGLKIGIITNSLDLSNLSEESIDSCDWIRISLSKLDINQNIDQLNIKNLPSSKLSFSYIVNEKTSDLVLDSIRKINEKYSPKFVRIAPDCLGDESMSIKQRLSSYIDKMDGNMFIKEINDNYKPYCKCYVGLVRPYWTSEGVYICTSHVLETQKYENRWKMCGIDEIEDFYDECNSKFGNGEDPYIIDISKCYHCYYYNNNKLLHSVSQTMEDKDFA